MRYQHAPSHKGGLVYGTISSQQGDQEASPEQEKIWHQQPAQA